MEVYVLQDGERRGPFPVFRLQEMLDDKEIGPDVPVWHAGMNEWRRLADEPSLNTSLRLVRPAAEPPPLPEDHAAVAADEAGRRLMRRLEAGATEQTAAVLKARRAVAWRRFVARIIDLHMARAALVGGLALADADRAWDLMFPALTVVFVAPLAWVLGEAVCLKLAGTTPGRAMLGLRVRDRDGEFLTFRAALKRSILVWAAGSGLGLPMQFLLPPAQWAMGFHQYQTQGETIWDRTAGSLDPCYFWPDLTEGSTMSMFGKILGKLGFPTRDSGRTPGSSGQAAVKPGGGPGGPAAARPASGNAGRPAAAAAGAVAGQATARAPGVAAAPAAAPAPAPAATPAAEPAPQRLDAIDVTRQLEERAAASSQPLNWRTSIVDLLKLLDLDSSLAARKELATELGCPADLMGDSARMNVWLHKAVLRKLAENGGKVPQELAD